MTTESRRLRSLRRYADALDLTLSKVPERSRWHAQYGPYMLLDPSANNLVVVSGLLDLDEVETWLAAHEHESEKWRHEDPEERL